MQAWGLDATGLTPELEGQIRLAIVRLQTAPSRNKKEEKLPRDPCLTEIANIAKQIESGYPDIYREMGYILEKKGQASEASQSFEKYLELSPNAPDRRIVESRIKN